MKRGPGLVRLTFSDPMDHAAGVGGVAAEGEKSAGVAGGAKLEVFDARGRDAGGFQLEAVGQDEVELEAVGFGFLEGGGRKAVLELGSDLVTAGADRRTEDDAEVFGVRAQPLEAGDGFGGDFLVRALPTGVDQRDGFSAFFPDENREAVGGSDGQDAAQFGRDERVAVRQVRPPRPA